MFASRVIHITKLTLSQVKSADEPRVASIQVRTRAATPANAPNPKSAPTWTFVFNGICRRHNAGIGNAASAKSVNEAVAKPDLAISQTWMNFNSHPCAIPILFTILASQQENCPMGAQAAETGRHWAKWTAAHGIEIATSIPFTVHNQVVACRDEARIRIILIVMAILGRIVQMIDKGIEMVCHSITLKSSARPT